MGKGTEPTGMNGFGPYQEVVRSAPTIAQPPTPPRTTTRFAAQPSEEEAIAAKRELVPTAELTEMGARIAPAQAHGREIETVSAPESNGSLAADGGSAPLPPPMPDYLPVDGPPNAADVGHDPRPLGEQVAEAGEQIAPAQQHGREIATVAGDGWESTPAADLLVRIADGLRSVRAAAPIAPMHWLLSGIFIQAYLSRYHSLPIVVRSDSQAAQQKPPQAAQQQNPPAPADAVAMKREYAPAVEVAAAAERIAPDQTHAREITSVAGDTATRQPSDTNGLTSAPSDASDIKVSSTQQCNLQHRMKAGMVPRHAQHPLLSAQKASLIHGIIVLKQTDAIPMRGPSSGRVPSMLFRVLHLWRRARTTGRQRRQQPTRLGSRCCACTVFMHLIASLSSLIAQNLCL